ncbi:MAG TPA: hypothetical protein VMN60_05340 [Longimicrobiales bacterium]|nr:hypothetical protein [Longimicrobiales bacterium]
MVQRSGRRLVALAAAVLFLTAACADDNLLFLEGPSPITAIAINNHTVLPADNTTVPRFSPFAYNIDVHYDYRPQDFISPGIELWAEGIDVNGNTITLCQFELGFFTPPGTSGERKFAGSFTLPFTAACASAVSLDLAAWLLYDDNYEEYDYYRYRIQ